MDDVEPPSKRAKISDLSSQTSFSEILEKMSSSVKFETDHDQVEASEDDADFSDDKLESNHDQYLDAEDLMKINFKDEFELLKVLLKKILHQKDSDYFNLELQHDATVEKLEQYEENVEAAKREINKNREVIGILEDKLQKKVKELEYKTEKISKAEPILKDLAKNAKNDKAKIAELEQKLIESDERVKQREDFIKCYKTEIQKIIATEEATKQSIKMKENEINVLKNALASKDSRISQHSEDNLKKMIDLQETINTKDMEITKLQFKNAELSKTIEESKAKTSNFFVLDKDNAESNHLENLLEDKENELKTVNNENNELLEILNKKEDEIKKLEYQNKEKLNDNKKLKSSVDKLLDKLDFNKRELDTLKRSYKSHFEALNTKYEKFVLMKQPQVSQINLVKRQQKPSSPQLNLVKQPSLSQVKQLSSPHLNVMKEPELPQVNVANQPQLPHLNMMKQLQSPHLSMMKQPSLPHLTQMKQQQQLNTPADIKKRLSSLAHLNISQKNNLQTSSTWFPPPGPITSTSITTPIKPPLPAPGISSLSLINEFMSSTLSSTSSRPSSLSLSPPGPPLPDLISNTNLQRHKLSSSLPNTSSLLSTDDEDSLPSLAEQTSLPREIPVLSGELF